MRDRRGKRNKVRLKGGEKEKLKSARERSSRHPLREGLARVKGKGF